MFLVDSLCSQMSEFLRTLTMCAVIGYGGYCIINGSMSVGVLVIFITYSQRLMSHIERLLNFTNVLFPSPVLPTIPYFLPYSNT